MSLVTLSKSLSATQKYCVKSSAPCTSTERLLLVVSSVTTAVILMFTPSSTSISAEPLSTRNQVMLGAGLELAVQEKDALSPTSRGAVDTGCWVMFTKPVWWILQT